MPRPILLAAVALVTVNACAHGAGTTVAARPTTGDLAGIARDLDSGEPIANASLRLRAQGQLAHPTVALTTPKGTYLFPHLAPGRYDLVAEFAGQQISVGNVQIDAGDVAVADVTFTLGRPDPIALDYFNDPHASEIVHAHPKALAASHAAAIAGTVADLTSRKRIAGAVISVVDATVPNANAQQAVTDDQGRYRFDVAPGTYNVSAYYSIAEHGQIEVRRGDIAAAAGELVTVPLWIESTR